MERALRVIAVISLFLVVLCTASCKSSDDSAREYERMEKKMLKEEDKAYKAAKKEHLRIQSKATREMMRNSNKKAKKLNKYRER